MKKLLTNLINFFTPKFRDYENEAKEARSTAEKAIETLEASKKELNRIKTL